MHKVKPIHPGEILKEEFLDGFGITAYRLAKDINVPLNRITEITSGNRSISAETAVLLAKYFDNSVGFWMNLQTRFDQQKAMITMKKKLDLIEPISFKQNSGLNTNS